MKTQVSKMKIVNVETIRYSPYIVSFYVFSVNLLSFSLGACFAWPTIIGPTLEINNTFTNPLPTPVTELERKWVIAFMSVGAAIGPILAAVSTSYLGKKKTLLLTGLPLIAAHLLCVFEIKLWYIFVARALMGLSTGFFFVAMPSYLADIAEDDKRGLFICIMTVFINLGALFADSIGYFNIINAFSLTNIMPLMLFYLTFGLFVPESPYDLIKKDKLRQAARNLIIFKGDVQDGLGEEFFNIVRRVKVRVKIQDPEKLLKVMKVFMASQLVNAFLVFHQMNGFIKIVNCVEDLFDVPGARIIVSIALFSSILAALVVDKLGRKLLLVIAIYFIGVSLFTCLMHFVLKINHFDNVTISWITLVGLLSLITAHSLAGSIPWILMVEIFSFNIRDVECALASIVSFVVTLVLTILLPELEKEVGIYVTLFIVESMVAIVSVFFVLSIPETKGKRFEEID